MDFVVAKHPRRVFRPWQDSCQVKSCLDSLPTIILTIKWDGTPRSPQGRLSLLGTRVLPNGISLPPGRLFYSMCCHNFVGAWLHFVNEPFINHFLTHIKHQGVFDCFQNGGRDSTIGRIEKCGDQCCSVKGDTFTLSLAFRPSIVNSH